jgi:phosphatidylglycerophosphatase A
MNWYVNIATLGPIGYMNAPGTMASIATLPLVYWLHTMIPNQYVYLSVVIFALVSALWILHKAIEQSRWHHDPSEVVIDEVVGCLITFWGIALSGKAVLVGFILFRIFDILKIGGIHYLERLPGEWGIMSDDIMAGLISNLILRLLL